MGKTIFITSFHPFISRNILQTPLLSLLVDDGYTVALLVPDYKARYFLKEFGGARVRVEGVSPRLTRRDLLFRRFALAITPTRTLFIKKRSKLHADKRLDLFLLSVLPAWLFGWSSACIRFFRFVDRVFPGDRRFSALFAAYRPAVAFSTDVQNELDVEFMKEAQRRGVRTVGMVRSWDNLTAKGVLRVVPDRLIAQNEIMKRHAVQYGFVPEARIRVVGIPHYDRYHAVLAAARSGGAPVESRDAFFARHGFRAGKKVILFAPMGDRYLRKNETDCYVLEILSRADAHILVRLPPGDVVNFDGFRSERATVSFEQTGTSAWEGGVKLNEIGRRDDDTLIASLLYADILVTGYSTMVIDGSMFDRPVVVAAFDRERRAYWDSIRRYHHYDHFKPVIASGAVTFARTPEELTRAVRVSLTNPYLHATERRAFAEAQAYQCDGKAVERLFFAVRSA